MSQSGQISFQSSSELEDFVANLPAGELAVRRHLLGVPALIYECASGFVATLRRAAQDFGGTMSTRAELRTKLTEEFRQYSKALATPSRGQCTHCGRTYNTLADIGSNCIGYFGNNPCGGSVVAAKRCAR